MNGPFAPGHTYVQVACQLPAADGTIAIAQRFPAALEQVAVVVKKLGDTRMSSPQVKEQRELRAQGEVFIAGTGGAVPEGQPLQIGLTGIPHHSGAPRLAALTLAGVIIVVGVWAAGRPASDPSGRTAERKKLAARRDRLFNDLVRLEQDRRSGRADARRYASRREEILTALESIYSALDGDDAGPEPADRAGLAA